MRNSSGEESFQTFSTPPLYAFHYRDGFIVKLPHVYENRCLHNGTPLPLIPREAHTPLEDLNEGALQMCIRTLNSLIADFARGTSVDGEGDQPRYPLDTS